MPKITIRNLDTESNRRIKLIKTSTSVVDVGEQNGAVSDQSDSVHICLAPLYVCSPTYYAGDAALSENYDPKTFEYKINDLDFVELTIAESGTYLTSSIFNAINADTGISDLFVAGGTGYYAFTDNGANFTVEGGDGSDTFDPVTIVLRDSQTTIIADMFGSSEVTLHSCGMAAPIDV